MCSPNLLLARTNRKIIRSINFRINPLSANIILFIGLFLCNSVIAADFEVNKNWRSIAIKGYDTVAYFTMGKAVKGKSKYEHKWQNARWRFSSNKHKEMFQENPDLYAPRFGGFCAGGISIGQKAPIDPKAWLIVDGKLYLNYDKKTREDLKASTKATIDKANKNWKILGETQ